MGKSKNKKVETKKRPEDRHLRLKCKYKDCRKKIRSDKVQAHYRQHERIYLRNEKGEFQSKKATVRVTTLPSGSTLHRPGHQLTERVTTISPSGSPLHRPGHHPIRPGHQNDRPGHQNLQEETHTLSASSFNDEEIPVWNFDPKVNSNLALIEEAERQEEVSKKSKKIKKNFKN